MKFADTLFAECESVRKFVRKLPAKSEKKDFIYNMFGCFVNAIVSVILLVVVSNFCGNGAAGSFSLAYSTAQMMYTISVFEMRNIQITDARRQFPFSHIGAFRVVTNTVMCLFFIIFCIFNGYSGNKLLLMFALTAYMSMLSFSDLFQGNMQLNGYLSIAGKSLTGQCVLASFIFTISLIIRKSLILSTILMIAVIAVWILLYDIPYNNNFNKLKLKFDFTAQKNMLFCALPLFLSSFLHQYIFNAPKYAIDKSLTELEQSYYSYLIMPVFCINLLSLFVFRPQLVALSLNWVNGNLKQFKKTVTLLYLWVAVATVAVMVGGYFLGIPVLEMLYNADLSGKRGVFMLLLLAGGFSAGCSLTLNLITILRQQKYCLLAYFVTFTVSVVLPAKLVKSLGLTGAALSYSIEMSILLVLLLITFAVLLFKRRNIIDE